MRKKKVVEIKSNSGSLWTCGPCDPIVGKSILWLDEDGALSIHHKHKLSMHWVAHEKKKSS